jgi:adenine-specific DNA-methyltransferase
MFLLSFAQTTGCTFLSACLRMLSDRGNLAFVLPAAWDYAQYANTVRIAVLQQFQSVEVYRCHEPLFPNVREGCVVLVAKNYRKSPERAVRIDHRTPQSLIEALTVTQPKPTRNYRQSKPTDDSFVKFSDLYNVNIGCVTGDASYFLLTESERICRGLPLEAMQPVISKARQLAAAYMTSAEWRRLLRNDERVWLFRPHVQALKNKAVQAYIRHGEKVCDLLGYKLSRRDPWYCVPDINENAIGFISGNLDATSIGNKIR